MKAGGLIDACCEQRAASVVIKLPNGQHLATSDYQYDTNKKGQIVIVIEAGRKLAKYGKPNQGE